MNKYVSWAGLVAAFCFVVTSGAPARAESHRTVDSMTNAHFQHTATLLLDGRVLVVGGDDGASELALAELFDPTTGRWLPTRSMAIPRERHTATLLNSGKVLAVGGKGDGGTRSSAELFDPVTETWQAVGNLASPRREHTATRLQSGEVLVVGGSNFGELASVEIYDPVLESWRSVGSLATARHRHTATLLVDGRVLVAGGLNDNGVLHSVEIFDPATEIWQPVSPLGIARYQHTATLLADGRLLVAGGRNADETSSTEIYDPQLDSWSSVGSLQIARREHAACLMPSGKVVVLGGREIREIASTELFDPVSETWVLSDALELPRHGPTATLLGSGSVLVAGGFNGGELITAEVLDLAEGLPTPAGSMAVPRRSHTSTLLDTEDVLVVGGAIGLHSAEVYSADGTWRSVESLTEGRWLHTATRLLDGRVIVIGGFGIPDGLTSVELFDPDTEQWTAGDSLFRGRREHTATLLPTGEVLVAGGRDIRVLSSTELFGAAGQRLRGGNMIRRRHGHTATLLLSGEVLVAGGSNGSRVSFTEIFDRSAGLLGTWREAARLNIPRARHTATLLPSGQVLVVGGDGDGVLASAELYDPDTDTWTRTGSLVHARTRHTAALLRTGKVLVTGGAVSDPETGESRLDSVEIYDPGTGTWTLLETLETGRIGHIAEVLANGEILIAGGSNGADLASSELYQVEDALASRRPEILSTSPQIRYGEVIEITGLGFFGDTEASSGTPQGSAVNTPMIELSRLDGTRVAQLVADSTERFDDGTVTLTVTELPPTLLPGPHLLRVAVAGVRSEPEHVEVICGLLIIDQPEDQAVALGSTATFQVSALGGDRFQWRRDGIPIDGAMSSIYATPPVTPDDSGAVFDVLVGGACETRLSGAATLTAIDTDPPSVTLVSPVGGEYWLLSDDNSTPRTELVVWSMSDNARICRLEVRLLFSDDGGLSYQPVPENIGVLLEEGPGGRCRSDEQPEAISLVVTVPTQPPSGRPGSLYKVEVRAIDHAGLEAIVESANPFFIVKPNLGAVKTLILANTARMQAEMGISGSEKDALDAKLTELANHPEVAGLVVDLDNVPTFASLYQAWDDASSNSDRANDVLFGEGGIHEYLLQELLPIYDGVEYLMVIGDDHIIPMARIQDRTVLLPESSYLATGDITDGSRVGQAFAANKYLSDEPLAVLDDVRPIDLSGSLFIADLAIGRLVETPEEIISAITTFISVDGALDLTAGESGNKILVTGYDFLRDSGTRNAKRWLQVFGQSDCGENAPVDCEMLTRDWGEGSVDARKAVLRQRLAGNGAEPFLIHNLNGHATHYELGVPGINPFDIQGLNAVDIYGPDACGSFSTGALDLAGSVVYAVGCHGGLSVPGSCATDADHSLDLPQTLLARGVQVFVANSGYGWGLVNGIGYGERLVQFATEKLAREGVVIAGEAVRDAKLQYFLETPHFDPYDEKSLMQWTLYGFPMYSIQIGAVGDRAVNVAQEKQPVSVVGDARGNDQVPSIDRLGQVAIERRIGGGERGPLPSFLTQLNLRFDLSASGVYLKRTALGEVLPETIEGCPEPSNGDPAGCYYTLNEQVDRGSGVTDLPIQPYLFYRSQLVGTSQRGVLWLGGVYDEESDWVPVVAELASNGIDASNHGSTPRSLFLHPITNRAVTGRDPAECAASDSEVSGLVLTTGEAVRSQDAGLSYDIQRLYREVDLEVFYFNNTQDLSENCDRSGPEIEPGPFAGEYHQLLGSTLEWAVPAHDEGRPDEVWRILVVVNDGRLDAQNQGRSTPIELIPDGTGTWRGALDVSGMERLTYLIQAVDRRGNVSWLEFETTELPASGVPPMVPQSIDVEVGTTGSCAAMRSLPQGYAAGQSARVEVEVMPADSALVYAVEETPPVGWEIFCSEAHGCSFDATNHVVRWGPFFDSLPRNLTYEAAPPVDATDPGVFRGVLSVDGQNELVCGESVLAVGSFHPADLDTDWGLDINEVTGYGAAWRVGQPWVHPPNPIPIDYVTNGGQLWQLGESYRFDASIDPPWASMDGAVNRVTGSAEGSIETKAEELGAARLVTVSVQPNSSVRNYAVELRVPKGWTVGEIEHGGRFDPAGRMIRWGPYFDSHGRDLSYRAVPLAAATWDEKWVGRVSFDGISVTISEPRSLEGSALEN